MLRLLANKILEIYSESAIVLEMFSLGADMAKQTSHKSPAYIDLFAGCGGLSLGLEKAGFSLALAVEKSDMAAETFYHNFIERISDVSEWKRFASAETSVLDQAKSKLVVKELEAVLKSAPLLKALKEADIDLIAGGPPCQGFSMAGRRNPKDIRNKLPWQFLELVEHIQPKAVIIENVAGMRQNFVKYSEDAPFEQLRLALSETGEGYLVQPVLLNAMHFGVPQHRPRVMLIGIRRDVSDALGITVTSETWKSEFDELSGSASYRRPDLAPKTTHMGNQVLTVRDAIWDLSADGYKVKANASSYLSDAGSFARHMRQDVSWMNKKIEKQHRASNGLKNHILRSHAENIVSRFRLYQYLRDNGIPSRTLNIPAKSKASLASKVAQLVGILSNAKFPAVAPDGTMLAKNANELARLMIALNTKKHSQRPLCWKSPSPTIVSLPDDFVHPAEPRTLTVREMARFQSFPDAFEFRAKETTGSMRRRFEVPQYTQVGNAVPPLMAYAVGKMIFRLLASYNASRMQGVSKKAV